MKQLLLPLAFLALSAQAQSADYTTPGSAFVLNEGWFGHENGSLNFFDGNDWTYHAFAKENPGHELGCTSQYATIVNGRLYVTSKQEKDGGATITGGRLTVADAKTLELIAQKPALENDGSPRGLAATDKFLYVATTAGVLVYDIETLDHVTTLGTGEYGTLVANAGRIFAVPGTGDIAVIDASTNTIETTIATTGKDFNTIVSAHDGNLYASTYSSEGWSYVSEPSLLRINPETLSTETLSLGDFCASGFPVNWTGWNAGGLVASPVSNRLYWSENAGWGTSLVLFYYDLDAQTGGVLADFTENAGYGFYSGAIAVHPTTGAIHAALSEANWGPGVNYRVIEADGTISYDQVLSTDYPYSFPALVFFPEQTGETGINSIAKNIEKTGSYDLFGRRANAETRGIVIENGRKTLKK